MPPQLKSLPMSEKEAVLPMAPELRWLIFVPVSVIGCEVSMIRLRPLPFALRDHIMTSGPKVVWAEEENCQSLQIECYL